MRASWDETSDANAAHLLPNRSAPFLARERDRVVALQVPSNSYGMKGER